MALACLTFYIRHFLTSPVHLDFFPGFMIDVQDDLICLFKVSIAFAKLSIHDTVGVFFFIFPPEKHPGDAFLFHFIKNVFPVRFGRVFRFSTGG
ncbi:hypothetical protein ALO_03661 [Acetonema longum DSM 6540]|uniref:Uncharacterized protein n=1 Tax=Acetonema longum DSM 6540 TaxID=1009370 RepID=F7NFA5_9FIRM|nr:hypothetical protein ALO_03661 [Acetonema longum DSM 6540]